MIPVAMSASRARWARTFFPLLLIVACPAIRIAAQQPELSTISVPIRLDLTSLSPEIEKRVEKTFNGTAKERGIDIEYKVARDPIRLAMIGGGLHSSTTVRYAMQACRGRFPCVSCGFTQARREAQITLHTKLDWEPSWRLRSQTALLPVNYPKPCAVTWFDIDITRRFVAPVVEKQLTDAAKIIDRNTPIVSNIRPQAQQIWTALQTPFELAPRTWLVMDPIDVALTPVKGAKEIATSTLSLRTQTRVVIGEKPATTHKPLPNLRVVAEPGSNGMRVPFDLELPYEEASRLASRDYANKTYRVNGKDLKLESLRVGPSFNGRVSIEAMIDYRGGALRNYRGLLFLEGTPRFDPATATIVVPDLDYSLDPKKRRGFFSRIAEKAAHLSIRQRLRESARFPIGTNLAETRAEITRALTRQLAPGAMLRGRADAIEPVSVTPLTKVISVRVIATGVAEVTLKQ
jgi:uncharacterized protein DUF4403